MARSYALSRVLEGQLVGNLNATSGPTVRTFAKSEWVLLHRVSSSAMKLHIRCSYENARIEIKCSRMHHICNSEGCHSLRRYSLYPAAALVSMNGPQLFQQLRANRTAKSLDTCTRSSESRAELSWSLSLQRLKLAVEVCQVAVAHLIRDECDRSTGVDE
jgi:hypothetical protein